MRAALIAVSPTPHPLSLSAVLCASLSLAQLLLGGRELVCTEVSTEHAQGPQSGAALTSSCVLMCLSLLPPLTPPPQTPTPICPFCLDPSGVVPRVADIEKAAFARVA